jgi:flagellar basal body L-ring protein FlgH
MCGKTTRHEKQLMSQFSGPTVDDCLTVVVRHNAEADVSGSNELTRRSSEGGDARVGLKTHMHHHAELPQALQ